MSACVQAAEMLRATNSLPFHDIYLIHINTFAVSVYQKNDSQTYRRLSCSYGDHKDREYLSDESGRGNELRECHEVYIHGVEHELDGHQYPDGVSSGQHTEDSHAEENGTQG